MEAVQSIQKQTYPNIELIVVDDASDLDNKEKVYKLSLEHKFRYIYIPKEASKGGNHARNVGVMASEGKYVAFLDDDDVWMEEKIEKQIAVILSDAKIGLVSCGRIREYNFQNRVPMDNGVIPEGDLSTAIWERIPFTTSTILVDKEVLLEVGLFDEQLKFWQEYELLIRLAQTTIFGVVREHLVLYRIIDKDKARLTNNIDGWENAVQYIVKKHEKLLEDLPKEIYHKHQVQIAKDGLARAINISNKGLQKKYLGELYKLEPSVKNKVKYIMNIPELSFWKNSYK